MVVNIALHYDLRMQLDGSTVSWAIPKGLLGKLHPSFELATSLGLMK